MRAAGLAVVMFLAASCSRCSSPATTDSGVIDSGVATVELVELHGRVFDADGAPVEGATISAFGDPETWAPQQFLDRGEGRDCVRSPLACPGNPAARVEVWRQLDSGTLVFPKALATTTSAGDGTFVLRSPERDVVISASFAGHVAWATTRETPWADVELTFAHPGQEIGIVELPIVAVTSIDPFTRTVTREPWDGGRTWASGAPWYGVEFVPDAGIETLFEITRSGRPAEATIELSCGLDGFQRLSTDGGRARTLRQAKICRVEVRSPDGWHDTSTLEHRSELKLELHPLRPLRVRWSPAVRTTSVEVRELPDPLALGGVGLGGPRLGTGTFDGGVAHFWPRAFSGEDRALEVSVRQPGFVATAVRFDGGQQTELDVELVAARGMTGVLVDEKRRPVPDVALTFSFVDGGVAGTAWTDARGGFGFSPPSRDVFTISGEHLLLGAVFARTDAHDGTLTLVPSSGPVTVELIFERPDGGLLRNGRVTVWDVSMATDDAGTVRLPGRAAGEQDFNVRDSEVVELGFVDAGTVSRRVRLSK